jgi:DNA polymerase III alpha subunit
MLRKLLTKKGTGKGHEKKDAIHKKFIEGCVEKQIRREDAQKLWQTFEYFSGYGFNKSHAVSYSILSYQCAYLLTYYSVEWLAAFLDKEPEGRKEQAINIVQSLGYRVKRPDINESGQVWEISAADKKTLVQPLTSIKGLGDKAVEQILQHRPFNNVEELLFNDDIVYSKLNKKALDVLARCGAMNSLMDERFTGMKHFWSAVAVDRPKKVKDLLDNIELYKPEGDFSDVEKVEYLTGLTGIFPFSLVLKDDVYDSIKKNKIPALGDYDKAIGVAWFIPREVIEKKTKTGKPYYIVKTIDDTNNQFAIKCWGVNPALDRVAINRPYLAKLDYNETWGFSSRSISRNWRMIG